MRWLSILLMAGLYCAMSITAPAQGPDPLADLKQFGDFPKIDIKRLLDGEILSQRGPLMKFPNGISSQLIFAVPTSPAETVKRFQTWDSKRCPSLKVYASQELRDPCELKEFTSLSRYLDPSLRPVRWLLDQTMATSGKSSTLNLTQIEAVVLAGCVGNEANPEAVGACWANLLFARAASFQHNGFASTLSYDFEVNPVDPALHLRSMLQEQVGISREFAPLLHKAGLADGGAGITPLRPSYYRRMFQADHHATLSLGAAYDTSG